MKKINKSIILAIALAFTFFGCGDDLPELNVDPNNPTAVPAANLLTQGEYSLYSLLQGRNLNAEWGLLMTQQWAQNEYAEESRFEVDGNSFNGAFLTLYSSVLNELNEGRKLIEAGGLPADIKANQLAIVDILMAYTFQVATDGFGDMPYSQALNAVEFPNPAYDSQQSIYEGILGTYQSAVASMNTSAPSFTSGDAIFNGDMVMWKKLGNSLMLRAAMRYAEREPAAAGSFITAASADLITSPADNAMFTFTSGAATANPLYIDASINNRDDFCVSEKLVTTLQAMGDPRLPVFAAENADGDIVGMPFGLTDADAFALKPNCSRPSELVRSATAPHVIIGAGEVNFLLAEAYQKGLLSGDAAGAYAAGIAASMNYWGITDATAIAAYVAANPYDAANYKESLGMQKWIALYMNGYEGWAENRRLGFPALTATEAAVIDIVPLKLPYPISEQTNNEDQLSAVSSNFDDIQSPVWWDQ